jgi:hypothetical protein
MSFSSELKNSLLLYETQLQYLGYDHPDIWITRSLLWRRSLLKNESDSLY